MEWVLEVPFLWNAELVLFAEAEREGRQEDVLRVDRGQAAIASEGRRALALSDELLAERGGCPAGRGEVLLGQFLTVVSPVCLPAKL